MKIQMQHQEGAAVFTAPLARVGVPLRCRRLMCCVCILSGGEVAHTEGGVLCGQRAALQPDFHGLSSSQGDDRGNVGLAWRVRRAGILPVNLPRVPARARGVFSGGGSRQVAAC